MLASLIHRIARPIARLWITQSARSWRTLPVPADAPLANAAGINPDRVLLIGSGPTVSYGVRSYNLGLAGSLARRLSHLTHRGISVYVRADPDMTVPDAVKTLQAMELSRFDAVVVTLGGIEAMSLFPARKWRAQIEKLISVSPAPVFIVGIMPISATIRMPRLLGSLATAHARRINAQSEAAADSYANVTFVPFFPEPGDIVSMANRNTYAAWAELIAPPIAVRLAEDEPFKRDKPVPAEDSRQRSLDAMDIDDAPESDALQRVVDTVRELFGSSGAGVNIIDHSLQRVLVATGMSREDRPREESLCNATVERGELLVVNDPAAYTKEPWSKEVGDIKFYAGYPIESREGHRIGALCIVDTKTRVFDDTDRALLRDLALHTQSVLWERQLRS